MASRSTRNAIWLESGFEDLGALRFFFCFGFFGMGTVLHAAQEKTRVLGPILTLSLYQCPFFSLLDTHAQRAGRRGLFAAGIKARKAVLTDCSSGKYSATSGESRTRFVPAR